MKLRNAFLLVFSCIFPFLSALAENSSPAVNPRTGSIFQPKPNVPLVVVFGAHPDDETIGISGHIASAIAQGKQVVVEMMTDGWGSGAQAKLRDQGYPLSDEKFGHARLAEFTAAMRVLGVDGVHWNRETSLRFTAGDVRKRIDYWENQGLKSVEYLAVAGRDHDYAGHDDHHVIYEAFRDSPIKKVKWFLVYQYRNPNRAKYPGRERLKWKNCVSARLAKQEYRVMDPQRGRYAIGWIQSTPDLFGVSYSECTEYLFDRRGLGDPRYSARH